MASPLVSIIVPTLNSAKTLPACLESIKQQSYTPIELIVVDNHSKDDTLAIAKEYTPKAFSKGPERSTQRNYGVSQAKGAYVVIIDSDMELTKDVIKACVQTMQDKPELSGITIPEESFGEGFWAQCKKLERSFYVGIDWMEAARFFRRELYVKAKGYNEQLISGEDWDLSQRIAKMAPLGRVDTFIMHNEGRLKLGRTLKKKYYYAQQIANYLSANQETEQLESQTGVLSRYKLYFSKPGKLFAQPVLGLGMLFMKTCELGFGGVGYLLARRKVSKA